MILVNVPPSLARLVYPLQERVLHRPTFQYLKELEVSQWYSRDEIEALQERKLAGLLRLAHDHSPWHAERIERAGLLETVQREHVPLHELRKLPTMTKRDARENVERIHWKDAPGGTFEYNTGGSSGEPLVFWFGRSRQASDAAGRMRARRWWGVQVGDRECYLWGSPVELGRTDWVKKVRDRLINQLVLNAFEMSPANMDGYAHALLEFQPECIYGYASSIALLAAHIRARDLRLHLRHLKVVCTTGEPLYAHQRELLQAVFAAPVANEFGSRDIGFTAHESASGEMLLMSESIILEVLDTAGAPVGEGEMGEAVITALHSEAQPFIRYRTGDMVRMSDARASAGRGLHVIAEVSGRTTDLIVRSDGTIMHALALIYVLRATPGIAEFKLIQLSVRDIQVLVVPGADWTSASEQQVIAGVQARLGADARVRVDLVQTIAPERSGKYRYVQSHVPLTEALRQAGPAEYA